MSVKYAGMSVKYYAKLERAHLPRLAHEANGGNAIPRRRPTQPTTRPGLQWMFDTLTTAPAIVGNDRSEPPTSWAAPCA
ncbi:hypothetical protein AB0K05_39910 [Nonomuraea sp. NPDC049486]|uniref:hypothetical protein n=1 Tax=Nonomuraea sp. NPDC049486 TaxID=3155773 RepID=UPI00341E9364